MVSIRDIDDGLLPDDHCRDGPVTALGIVSARMMVDHQCTDDGASDEGCSEDEKAIQRAHGSEKNIRIMQRAQACVDARVSRLRCQWPSRFIHQHACVN